MAIVTKRILGDYHGKIGDEMFKMRYGRQFCYPAPSKHKMSNSAAFKNEQSKFGLTVRFAKIINSVKELSDVWRGARVPGVNCYQKIIKNNLAYARKDSLTLSNIITPAGNDYATVSDITFGNNSITFLAKLKGGASIDFFNQPHKFFAILFLYEPKLPATSPYVLIAYQKEFDAQSSGTFEVELGGNTAPLSQYNKGLLFTAAVLLQAENKKNYWTSSFAIELSL
ncbi:MAG: hypothetical protein IPJ03_02220 [Ignavibacteriales bacterium]|nr:hypothetical protein [Ignavibacteriales bacterium]